jgi:ferrous iron transport protein A
MEHRLDELEAGQKACVIRVEGDAALRRRIMDMGLVPGTDVSLERPAPLADPIAFRVRGFELSLRRSEAAAVLVDIRRCCGSCGCGCGGCGE